MLDYASSPPDPEPGFFAKIWKWIIGAAKAVWVWIVQVAKAIGRFCKKHWVLLVILLIVVLFIGGLLWIWNLATNTATAPVTPTTQVVQPTPVPTLVPPTAIPVPTATAVPPVPTATTAPIVDPFAGYSVCPYKGTGSSQPEKVDVATFKLSDGRNVYALDLSKLPGCGIAFEGRFPWQTTFPDLVSTLSQSAISDNGLPWDPWKVHFIVDVRSILGNFDSTNYNKLVAGIPDQYKDWFVYSEGSFWFYDPTWNISDLKLAKPSIAQELEVKKFRDAMTPGAYNWPRIIMQPDGSMNVYWQHDSGDAAYANGIAAGCTYGDQPELIPVYGLWDGKQFSAAIGAGNCKMAYWADGSTTPVVWYGYQKDGKEIVSYQNSVIAYIFPASWSNDQVNTWISAHPGGK